jgi:IS1 family transposase
VVIELDEMWHFLQRKANKVWIWKAYDRTTGRLVDWECGDRDERTFRRLFDRLARWKVRLYCSDSYVVYPLVLAVALPGQRRNCRPGAQQRPAAALDSSSAAALHRRLQIPRHD